MAKNHEIKYIFFDKRDRSLMQLSVTHYHSCEIQNALVSERRTLLSWKVVNSKLVLLMPDEDKIFGSSLVLDLRI